MYIGVDIGGTNIAVGLVDGGCNIIERVKAPTLPKRGARAVIDDVSRLCFELAGKAGVKPRDIERIGMVAPGSVDAPAGIIIFAGNIPFDNSPVAEWMRESWSCPIFVENDANAAALGEVYAGAAKGRSSVLMITLGTGVGGGIVLDGKVYSGFNGTAGEVGHMVVEAGGRGCTCGRAGCWEAYASATGLISMTREAMEKYPGGAMSRITGELGKVSGKTAFLAAREGDAAGRGVVDAYIRYLSIGLANLINIFQPEAVCIGGGVCNEGEYLMKPLIEATRREQFKGSPRLTEICAAALGNDAGIIGAAMLGARKDGLLK
ncbi:MAG: ROK family protein [Oscillospiraceae bacterium]|nr:ROK family protein [Oscillospiraceae bacterium]